MDVSQAHVPHGNSEAAAAGGAADGGHEAPLDVALAKDVTRQARDAGLWHRNCGNSSHGRA